MTLPNYVTPEEVRAYMPANEVATATTWDATVTLLCANCSRAFDKLTFRQPGAYAVADDTTRYFDGVPETATDYLGSIFTDELVALTSVGIAPNGGSSFTALNTNNYWLWPYNAAAEGKPYLRIDLDPDGAVKRWPVRPRSVQVIGKFGYSLEVPADVQEAILLYIVRMVRKAQQNYLEVGTMLDSGQVMVGMKVDHDFQELILMYRKGRLA